MLHIDIGLSAIRAAQQGLLTVSNNIANANTEGYHRQRLELTDRAPSTAGQIAVGTGVAVAEISRLRDVATEVSLIRVGSTHAESASFLETLRAIETALIPSEGSLISAVSDFFNRIEQLGAEPDELTIRDSAIAAANTVTNRLADLDRQFQFLRDESALQIREGVETVNRLSAEIADLNQKIGVSERQGIRPNTLLDQRDRLVGELAAWVDLSPQSFLTSEGPLIGAGGRLLIGRTTTALDADAVLAVEGTQVASGTLAGLMSGRNVIDSLQKDLREWAMRFVNGIDRIQSTGLDQGERRSVAEGTRDIADADLPLERLNLPFPVDAGTLYVSTTELASGARTTSSVPVDPATDSLNDVIARLNDTGQLAANYDTDSDRVTLQAPATHTIDFVRPDGAADETGLLAALGIHSFFTGSPGAGLHVDPELAFDSRGLAVSTSSAPGDSSRVEQYLNLREQASFETGESLEERLISISTSLAYRVEAEESAIEFLENQRLHLGNARDSVSGVDPNEELLRMLEFQRMFQAASRFVTSVDESLDELFRIVR